MKKISTLTMILLSYVVVCQNASPAFLSRALTLATMTNNIVTHQGFDSIFSGLITKTVPDVNGRIKAGNNFGLSFNDDKTEATAQVAIALNNMVFSGGFRGAIEDKVFDIYNGKDKFGKDWGVNSNFVLNIPCLTYLKYFKKDTTAYRRKRNLFAAELITDESGFISELAHLDSIVSRYHWMPDSIIIYRNVLFSNNNADKESAKRQITRLDSILTKYEKVFGKNLEDITRPNQSIEKYIDSKFANFEKVDHIFSGFAMTQFIIQGFYNNKVYNTYNDTGKILDNRFDEITFDNYGGSIGLCYYRSTRKVFYNHSITFGLKNEISFDNPENKKYNKSYSVEELKAIGSGQIQYESKTKKAYDINKMSDEKYDTRYLSLQSIILFGKKKNAGINANLQYKHKKGASSPDKFDFGIGPVICITEKDEDISTANFSVLAGISDFANQNLNNRERYFIRFQVNLPLRVFDL